MNRHRDVDEDGERGAFEDLNKEQRVKAAMYYGLKGIAREVEEDFEVSISAQVLATLSESLNRQAENYAVDVELFAKHAKRSNVSTDDVKLVARRNPSLLEHLDSLINTQKAQKEASKKAKKAGPSSNKSSKSDAVLNLDD